MTTTNWEVTAERPAGGYVPIRADQLFAAWWCYERGSIELADLRVWFALQEVVARRCTMKTPRQSRFTTSELMELTRQRRRASVKASLAQLEKVGLARSRRSSIRFATTVDEISVGDRAAFNERLRLITNHRRRVPVPRRTLRWLAAGSRRVLIATVLGHLLRLLYLRNGKCRADGNCKASWLAAVFAINLRSVKQGRQRLIACGLLQAQEIPQWYRNRYGWRGAVNLEWTVDKSPVLLDKSEKRTPPMRRTCAKPSPPRQNQKLSSRNENRKPEGRRIGSCGKGRGCLGEINSAELSKNQCIERLFHRATKGKLVGRGDRLNLFAAAEHALRVGSRNPAGLFVWLLVNRRWDFVTQADEDAARRRLMRMEDSCVLLPPGIAGIRLLKEIRFPPDDKPDQVGMTRIGTVLRQFLAA